MDTQRGQMVSSLHFSLLAAHWAPSKLCECVGHRVGWAGVGRGALEPEVG